MGDDKRARDDRARDLLRVVMDERIVQLGAEIAEARRAGDEDGAEGLLREQLLLRELWGKPRPVDDHGYGGAWGDAKPGEVAPGISTDPDQWIRDMEAADAREIERDIIGAEIARISARLHEARELGDKAKVEELRAEQSRLSRLQMSI